MKYVCFEEWNSCVAGIRNNCCRYLTASLLVKYLIESYEHQDFNVLTFFFFFILDEFQIILYFRCFNHDATFQMLNHDFL